MPPGTQNEKLTLQPTGIVGLDTILNGGLPYGANIILAGAAGTGKTVFSHQWLFEGFTKYQEPGLYIALSESVNKALKNCSGFSYCKKESLHPLGVHFTDLRSIIKGLGLEEKPDLSIEETEKIIEVITNLVREMKAKRVVLDSITAFLYFLKDPYQIRSFIFKLGNALSQMDATVILISEVIEPKRFSVFGVEEFIADGIIYTDNLMGEQAMVRRMQIIKMRGLDFRSGAVVFDITNDGLVIYPKIPVEDMVQKTEYSKRLSSGITELDEVIDGGYPEGSTVLIGGNTGAGKSTFGLQFLAKGVEQGEAVLMVNLEESSVQVKKTARNHGWDFEAAEKSGLLTFLNPKLIDIYPDKLLYQIVNAVSKNNVKRVLIDSVSSLEGSTLDKDKVREFLLELSSFFKSRGVTSNMTYLTTNAFGASAGQLLGGTESSELRLSSIVDGILLLRYVERDQDVDKLLTVLKMRGSEHSKEIREFDITKGGVKIGAKFTK